MNKDNNSTPQFVDDKSTKQPDMQYPVQDTSQYPVQYLPQYGYQYYYRVVDATDKRTPYDEQLM